MPYFAFIDGMRALAVLAVILYHFELGVPGGYIGVDIFFVLSGFLITTILASRVGQPAGEFFAHFYERRARRILPALILMVVLCCAAAYFLLLPGDTETFGKSMRDMGVFFSNFSFSRKVGYFDGAANTKPLLHTWSLAVEEQFYLLFPPLLYVLARLLKRNMQRISAVLLVLFLLSLGASIAWIHSKPQVVFFLPHTRAWELLAGSLVALFGTRYLPGSRVANIVSIAALATLLFCMFAYSATTSFPGLTALPVVLASALLIWANLKQPSLVARGLSCKPLVWVGLISYGLYLYHWPILVFTRFYYGDAPPAISHYVTLPLLFLLAALSFRYIEEPIRHGRWLRRRRAVFIASALALIATFAGGQAIGKSGLDWRFSDQVRHYSEAGEKDQYRNICRRNYNAPTSFQSTVCVVGDGDEAKPDFLIWGDSHAGSLVPAADLMAKKYGKTGWVLRYSGCPGLVRASRIDEEMDLPCPTASNDALAMVKDFKIGQVMLVGRWDMYTLGWEEGSNETLQDPILEYNGKLGLEAVRASLHDTRAELRKLGAQPWVFRQIPPQLIDIPTALATAELFGRDRAALRRKAETLRTWHAPVVAVLTEQDASHTLDPFPAFCAEGAEYCEIEREGNSLYSDNDHLSIYGSQQIAPVLTPFFASMR